MPDIRYLHKENTVVPLVATEEDILGCFVIEKFMLQGYYLGPK